MANDKKSKAQKDKSVRIQKSLESRGEELQASLGASDEKKSVEESATTGRKIKRKSQSRLKEDES